MNANGIRVLLIIITAVLFIAGCSSSGKNVDDSATKATPPSNGKTVSVATASGDGAKGVAAAPAPITTRADASKEPPTKMPEPQIGSGGNDLFLFTQARARLNANAELKTANVILDVKDGVVTLSGTVSSAAQKSKAEELVNAVRPKAIKNQLRVSIG